MGENPFYHQQGYNPGLHLQDYPQSVFHPAHHHHHHQHQHRQDENDEEDYTIKCICGYTDDDGHTTLCELCNTWQHVQCYYWPDQTVPEVHQCEDCQPRIVDRIAAAARQRRNREAAIEERKAKRPAHKTHKKQKTKDIAQLQHASTNGWTDHERPPADYTPPLKRPKTHHRHSQSIHEIHQDVNAYSDQQRGPPPSPPAPPFLPPPLDAGFSVKPTIDHQGSEDAENQERGNEFIDIEVLNIFSERLADCPDCIELPHDYVRNHVPPIRRAQTRSGAAHQTQSGASRLLSNQPIAGNNLVGEITGQIGLQEFYMRDPRNQWDALLHPDHFVFFHPHLPIYIDGRTHGSLMKFARRGCDPNVKVSTIITGNTPADTHFYLTATRDIAPGEEIVLGWKPKDQYLNHCIQAVTTNSSAGPQEQDFLANWTNRILSHYGGCACEDRHGKDCVLRRYASPWNGHVRESTSLKVNGHKHRSQPSPLKQVRDNAKRLPSEGLRQDGYEEDVAVSSAISSRSRSSRDHTPAANGSAIARPNSTEPSEREKKKLQQQVRLLEKRDQENQKSQAKKKRRSGSNPNTPVVQTPSGDKHEPAQLWQSSASDPVPKQAISVQGPVESPIKSAPPALDEAFSKEEPATAPLDASPLMRSSSASPPIEEATTSKPSAPRQRPVYVDVGVQTLPDPELERPTPAIDRRRPFVPLSRRLLRRNFSLRMRALNQANAISISRPSAPTDGPEVPATDKVQLQVEIPDAASAVQPTAPDCNGAEVRTAISITTGSAAMSLSASPASSKPAEPVTEPPTPKEAVESEPLDYVSGAGNVNTKPNDEPVPPYSSTIGQIKTATPEAPAIAFHEDRTQGTAGSRPPPMHVDMPPSLFSSSTAPSLTDTAISTSPMSESVTSPISQQQFVPFAAPMAPMSAPILISSTPNASRPSPVKKKMSLSEYTNRNKAKTPGSERSQSFGLSDAVAAPRRESEQSSSPASERRVPSHVKAEGSL